MRKLIGLLGLGTGFAAGIAVLLFNPLHVDIQISDRANKLYWSAVESQGNVLDPMALLSLSTANSSEAFLDERNHTANAAVLVLRDETNAPVALATRIRVRNGDSNLLRADLGVETHTAIFWPNRGSAILYGYENRWPVLRDQLLHQLGWAALPESYSVTAARQEGRRVGVLGGSGKHAAFSGHYRESISIDPDMAGHYRGQIALDMQPAR